MTHVVAVAGIDDLTVDQVSELDLSYTPPRGSAPGWTCAGREHRSGGYR